MTLYARLAMSRAGRAFLINAILLSILVSMTLIDKLMGADIGLGSILEMIPAIILGSCPFALPLATVTACTQLGARWRDDGEISSLASSGLPLAVAARPITGLFALIALVGIPLFHDWSPRAQHEITGNSVHLLRQALIARARTGWPVVFSQSERLFTNGAEGEWMLNLIFTQRRQEKNEANEIKDTTTVLRAGRGRIIYEEEKFWLDCQDVQVDRISGNRASSISFDAHRVPLNAREKSLSGFQSEQSTPTDKLGDSPKARFEGAHRWVLSSILPILALMGLRLGWLLPWSNKAACFLVALLPIALIYIPCLMVCRTMIFDDRWPEETMAFPALGLIIGVFLLGMGLKKRGLQ